MPEVVITLLAGPFAPWGAAFVLLILFGTAAWDARTGIIPNIPILIGALAIIGARFLENGWRDALLYLGLGLGTWVLIFLINEGWYRLFKKDAIGMGDAKWTALAVATFGPLAAMFAWFAGSWISLLWIGGSYVIGQRIKKVYFGPFLFAGLLVGLCVLRGIVRLPYPLAI